uniref:Nucleosome assembly protein 1-like 4 n=1 Tax=Panagrolaimus superbus TaxID=310955 RepID=A0A914Z2S2_9BILA
MAAANLPNLAEMLGGDFHEEPLYAENVTKLTKQQAICVRAAKKIEKQCTDIEMEFFTKVHELETQFQARFKELTDKRLQIINGGISVSETDVADMPLIYGLPEDALKQVVDGLKEDDSSVKGVPDFWLHALQNCPTVEEMVEEVDIPILKHLKNIESELTKEPMGFILRFTFEENEYFSNTVIDKTYYYKLAPSEAPPHLFDGPIIDTCKVTPIEWKEGKNPCFKLVKRKQKKAKSGSGRFVTKQVAQASFFNFFAEDMSPETAESDFEISSLLREQVIPHATVYFTGELHDGDDFDDEDSFGSFEDGDDEDGEEEHEH